MKAHSSLLYDEKLKKTRTPRSGNNARLFYSSMWGNVGKLVPTNPLACAFPLEVFTYICLCKIQVTPGAVLILTPILVVVY